MDSCIVARVRLGGGVGVGVGATVAAKILASCRMAYMVWRLNRQRMRLVRFLQGLQLGAWLRLWLRWRRYCFGDATSPCLWYVNAVTLVVEWFCTNVPTLLAMEVPCAPLFQGLVDEEFCPWRVHGLFL